MRLSTTAFLVLVTSALGLSCPSQGWAAEAVPAAMEDPSAAPTQAARLERSGPQVLGSRVVPLPLVITEPAVGFGGGLVGTYFHGTPYTVTRPNGKTRRVPPSVSALGGLGTVNGTWGAFAGHMGVWADDRIRYLRGGGYASANLDYYGPVGSLRGDPRAFNLEGAFLLQDLAFRVGESDLFVGARYAFFASEAAFDRPDPVPGVTAGEVDARIGGLGMTVTYDDRDNVFSPTRGVRAQVMAMFFEPAFGSEVSFQRTEAYGFAWFPLRARWNLGVRLDLAVATGDPPFYAQPFVALRGVPALRYLVAPEHGLRVGLDVARGPEQWAFYIVFGNAWLRP